MVTLKAVVEALLFASQKPLALNEIAGALRSAAESFEDGPEAALAKAERGRDRRLAAPLAERILGTEPLVPAC